MRTNRTMLLALALCVPLLGGCTIAYDRYGNPVGAGFFVATTEEPTTFEKGAGIAGDVAWLIDPKLGLAVGGILTALGYGKVDARNRKREADGVWDEAVAFAMARQAPPVAPEGGA